MHGSCGWDGHLISCSKASISTLGAVHCTGWLKPSSNSRNSSWTDKVLTHLQQSLGRSEFAYTWGTSKESYGLLRTKGHCWAKTSDSNMECGVRANSCTALVAWTFFPYHQLKSGSHLELRPTLHWDWCLLIQREPGRKLDQNHFLLTWAFDLAPVQLGGTSFQKSLCGAPGPPAAHPTTSHHLRVLSWSLLPPTPLPQVTFPSVQQSIPTHNLPALAPCNWSRDVSLHKPQW